MPAAAVIPAPIAYIKVVAVKKLVVGFVVAAAVPALSGHYRRLPSLGGICVALGCRAGDAHRFTVNKSARSKQAYAVECISME